MNGIEFKCPSSYEISQECMQTKGRTEFSQKHKHILVEFFKLTSISKKILILPNIWASLNFAGEAIDIKLFKICALTEY